MSSAKNIWLFRIGGGLVLAFAGWLAGAAIGELPLPVRAGAGAIGLLVGLALTPYLVVRPVLRIWRYLVELPVRPFLTAVLGLLVGLLIGVLASVPLTRLPGSYGTILPLGITSVLAALGIALGIAKNRDLTGLLPETHRTLPQPREPKPQPMILDTSAIIDGRIADIGQTGFLQGALIIPRFVLEELQHIADSSDTLRRNRGRRGLEMLNKLRKESTVPIQVLDVDTRNGMEVDGKLVRLAKSMRAPIITTDFNLNRVAELQGVKALNINELANSLKPVVLPGEDMLVHVIQEGKEPGQGVGFLDDGTMVVVEGGKRYINSHLDIHITRVLQTAAGRIIFAQPKDGSRNGR